MQFDPLQARALDAVNDWMHDPYRKPWFYLAGFAGTGKTTIAKHFAEGVGKVCYGAYTGKAAHVMKTKGCTDATTIHRLIYNYEGAKFKGRKELEEKIYELQGELDIVLLEGAPGYNLQEQFRRAHGLPPTNRAGELIDELRQLREELQAAEKRAEDLGSADLVFSKGTALVLLQPRLLVLDECSMIDGDMGGDILSFNVPVLVLGDPAQLPPVKGAGFFTSQQPDFVLTEVHRQAAGNPVLDLATKVRRGEHLKFGEFGSSKVVRAGQVTDDEKLESGIVLTGFNSGRMGWNRTARDLLGYDSEFPQDNDKLIALKNHPKLHIYNGSLMRATGTAIEEEVYDGIIDLALPVDIDTGTEEKDPRVLSLCTQAFLKYKDEEYFDERDQRTRVQQQVIDADYAYALTVHKSQGSQWDHVTVMDDGYGLVGRSADPDTRRQWLYTAITRAADKVTVGLHPSAWPGRRMMSAWPPKKR